MRVLPSVDVIILSWNRRESTLETIANVQQQEDVHVEIWVVDQGSDASCLETLRALAADGTIHLIENQANTGVAAGRNQGMRAGQADWIVAIDNDAVFERRDALSRAVRRFKQQPGLAAIGFRVNNYHTGELDRFSWPYPRGLLARRDEEFLATRFSGGGHALRRSALELTRGYDESLFFNWEELDLGYQLIAAGFHIIYDPSIVVLHKVAPEARTSWNGGRYYYFVRNAVYLNYKYFRSIKTAALLAVGYQVQGIYNGIPGQSVRGVIDAIKLMRRLPAGVAPLNEAGRQYVYENETVYRGSLWQRVQSEALSHLR